MYGTNRVFFCMVEELLQQILTLFDEKIFSLQLLYKKKFYLFEFSKNSTFFVTWAPYIKLKSALLAISVTLYNTLIRKFFSTVTLTRGSICTFHFEIAVRIRIDKIPTVRSEK